LPNANDRSSQTVLPASPRFPCCRCAKPTLALRCRSERRCDSLTGFRSGKAIVFSHTAWIMAKSTPQRDQCGHTAS
jgi:hypothetical protein